MADSFADLWNATAPTKPRPPPPTLGSVSRASPAPSRPQNDTFAMLASSSRPNSRPITPSQPRGQNSRQPIKQPQASGGADAFSSLLGGSFAAGSGPAISIAERQAATERARREQAARDREALAQQTAVWDGLDQIGAQPGLRATSQTRTLDDDDDWGLSGFGASHSASASARSGAAATKPQKAAVHSPDDNDDWGLADFATPAASTSHSPQPANGAQNQPHGSAPSLFDALDDFVAPSSHRASPVPPLLRSQTGTPGDFDFGDREDRLLDNASDSSGGHADGDADDILGDLARPVSSPVPRPPRQDPAPRQPDTRATSPPPHVIGQLVEMGFTPQQARIALAATSTGLDVQQALETLLTAGAQSQEDLAEQATEEESRPRPRPRPRGNGRGAGAAVPAAPADTASELQLQERADRLLAQASDIGLSMLSRANAFWREGKEKVQRVYEERAAVAGSGAAAGRGRGVGVDGAKSTRPRWLVNAEEDEEGEEGWRDRQEGGFKDEDSPVESRSVTVSVVNDTARPPPRPSAKTANILPEDTPTTYVSPARRRPPAPRSQSHSPAPPPPQQRLPRVAPSPVPAPAPAPRLPTPVTAPPAALASANAHKAAGSELFALGRYADAAARYTAALAALPPRHLLRVPLHTNRALALLRTGDHAAAAADCTDALALAAPAHAGGARADGVDLAGALLKAHRRRAEALEARERWAHAQADWDAVAACAWAPSGVRGEAQRAAARCRRMVRVDVDSGVSAPAPGPAPRRPLASAVRRPPRKPAVATPPGVAADALRTAHRAQEAEDQARHELKDVVDARLLAWRGGKEANVRALIASLDTVLWPALGWQKVGMAELVSPSQVKIRYTKAIAKLHPDKLNTNNTTLEQRMIANGVFATLNDAWIAFKQ